MRERAGPLVCVCLLLVIVLTVPVRHSSYPTNDEIIKAVASVCVYIKMCVLVQSVCEKVQGGTL